MIDINYKVLLIIVLVVVSFINNLLLGFDNLKKLNEDTDIECFLVDIDPNINIEKRYQKKLKTIYQYIIFYIFFYNINDPSSIIDIINSY